jgi:glycosyltransferase involved in cell wall biosynthesis
MPKVSVLMPTYNQAQYIAQAIKSVLDQTFEDFEFIVVNDCSTDDTEQIIQKFTTDKRIKVIKNEKNLGDIGNLNKISGLAQGEYIKFLFSDDLLAAPCALEEFVRALDENADVSLVTSFYEYFGDYGNSFHEHPLVGKAGGYETIKSTVVSGNWIGGPSNVIFRKSDFAGMKFDGKWRWMSDYDIWHKLLAKGNIYVIPKFLVRFRLHEASWSKDNLTNYNNFHDEYYYLKFIRDNDLYAPLKDDEEFKRVLKRNALRWVDLIPQFYKEKKYNFLKKAAKTILEENLILECNVKLFKKIGRKVYKPQS